MYCPGTVAGFAFIRFVVMGAFGTSLVIRKIKLPNDQ
jgi:hypothetical protein